MRHINVRPDVLTCCEYMGEQLGAGFDNQRGIRSLGRGTNGAHLVGLFSVFLFGFTFKAISPVHIFCLVVSTIDIHRRRV